MSIVNIGPWKLDVFNSGVSVNRSSTVYVYTVLKIVLTRALKWQTMLTVCTILHTSNTDHSVRKLNSPDDSNWSAHWQGLAVCALRTAAVTFCSTHTASPCHSKLQDSSWGAHWQGLAVCALQTAAVRVCSTHTASPCHSKLLCTSFTPVVCNSLHTLL